MHPERKKFYLWAIITLCLIVIAVIVFVVANRPARPAAPNNVVVNNLSIYSMPENFPSNIPIEMGATITQNYNATTADGKIQATRAFASKKTVDYNFEFYKNFINDPQNGWTYLNEVNDLIHGALFASGSGGILSINISAGSAPGTSMVVISFLSGPAK